MAAPNRTVIGVAVGAIALVAAVVLADLFGTVVFAITVAYVLAPVQRWFLRRGWPRRRASIATAGLATAAVVALVAPLAVVAYQRREQAVAFLADLRGPFTIDVLGTEIVVRTADVIDVIVEYLPPLLVDAAVFLSAASIKLALFAILVFGLLLGHERARQAILAPVPPDYLPFVEAMEERARQTLVAILILQVGTAAGAFLLALPTFFLLGYDYVLVLSTVAGVLQFLPIIGPIVLLLALGALEVFAGDLVGAVLVVGVGGVVLGWLPDVIVRPRLARYTAGFSGSLYFVGFIGGLTSLGVIGIIVGPLVVALLVEGVDQLAAHMPHTDREPPGAEPE